MNLASAHPAYWRNGALADSRRVVVGEPETETPQLGSPIVRLVANPTWTVLFDDAGAPVVRSDPYGWNDRIAAAIGFAERPSRRVSSGAADVGP